MFLVDDVLLFPLSGSLWIFNEIYQAAQKELLGQADAVMAQLQQLYTLLERNEITEQEFEARETELLDRLEELEERRYALSEEDDFEDQDEDEYVEQ